MHSKFVIENVTGLDNMKYLSIFTRMKFVCILKTHSLRACNGAIHSGVLCEYINERQGFLKSGNSPPPTHTHTLGSSRFLRNDCPLRYWNRTPHFTYVT